MKTYSFEKINNVYVLGDCHGEFKTYFHAIKVGLNVKSEDEDKPHPKELERQARKAAREQAIRNAGRPQMFANDNGRRYVRFGEAPRPYDDPWYATTTLTDTAKKILKKSNFSIYSDSVFIIAGDCGIGFNKPKYYEDLFEKFNKILSYNNTYIIFVRGNHDDPAYFDGERINLSNIKAVPDYSVINANGKNILCVGGAISLDRTWRIKQEERINRFSLTKKKTIYWKDEAPVYNQDALNEIINSTKIDCVVSHSAPSFVNPESHNGIEEWSEGDSTLVSDIKEERRVLDKVFETLRDSDMRPKYWAYGHFDFNYIERRSDTLFRGLGDGFNPISIDMDIKQFIYDEEIKKKRGKEKKSAKPIKTLSNNGIGEEIMAVPGAPGGFRVDPIMAEADNHADEALPEEPEGEELDDVFDNFMDGDNNGVAVGAPDNEQAQENNEVELPDWGEAANFGGRPINLDEAQRERDALYERLRRDIRDRVAMRPAMRTAAARVNDYVEFPGIGAYTIAANNANGVTLADNNDVTVGTLNHPNNE